MFSGAKKKKFILVALLGASLVGGPATRAKADFMDYLGGCVMALGAGVAGTAFASSRMPSGEAISTTGYAISAGLSCLAGLAYVGIAGSSAEFEATSSLKKEHENLTFQLKRLSKERCLLKETCTPGGRSIIMDADTEVKKIGDKVIETSTSSLETNE